MAQVIYPSRFWPATPVSGAAAPSAPLPADVGLLSFGALAQTVESATSSGVQSLREASSSLEALDVSGADVCAHAETLEDLAHQLDRQMQALIDRTRDFTAALRGDLSEH